MSNEWPGGFISAKELRDMDEDEDPYNVTIFDDHGVRFCTGDERSEEFLWMEDMPDELENKC